MNIKIMCIGKLKEAFYRKKVDNMITLINKGNHSVEIMEYPDEKITAEMTNDQKEVFLEKECQKINDKITTGDYVIALCIEGKELSTNQHREYVKKACEQGYENIVYVIGGSLGLPRKIKDRANLKLSFSKMTFPHQIMRLVLCEEIATIIKK